MIGIMWKFSTFGTDYDLHHIEVSTSGTGHDLDHVENFTSETVHDLDRIDRMDHTDPIAEVMRCRAGSVYVEYGFNRGNVC